MTYTEFLNTEHWRPIPNCPGYLISSRGTVVNSETGYRLTRGKGGVVLYVNNKNKRISLVKTLLTCFPDVEFSSEELQKAAGLCAKKFTGLRGVYHFEYRTPKRENFKKKREQTFRAVISLEGVKVTIGYFDTKEDAYMAYYSAYLMTRGIRPW